MAEGVSVDDVAPTPALFRARAFARILSHRRSLTKLPIDALVGLFQVLPILSFHWAFAVRFKASRNPIDTNVFDWNILLFIFLLTSPLPLSSQAGFAGLEPYPR